MTELFLHAAARRQLVDESLMDWLRAGDLIIADRYVGSTFAYQGVALRNHPDFKNVARKRRDEILKDICGLATDFGRAVPGLNILYHAEDDNEVDAIIARQSWACWQEAEYIKDVNERYLELAEADAQTWRIIPVTTDRDSVSIAAATLDIGTERLSQAGLPPQREQASE